MKRSSTCGSGATTTRAWSTVNVSSPGTAISRASLRSTPMGPPSQLRRRAEACLRALDPAHREGVDAAVRLVGPGDGQLAAGEGRPQHLLDPGGVLDVGGHQPAGERLPLHVGRVGGLQPLDRDVERLAHGREDEVEARERRLAGREEGGEVEARRVGLAVGQPLRRAELDAVGGGPDRRALDPRLEAEGRGVEGCADLLGAGHGLVEGHADRALARDRAAREGGHDRLLGLASARPARAASSRACTRPPPRRGTARPREPATGVAYPTPRPKARGPGADHPVRTAL